MIKQIMRRGRCHLEASATSQNTPGDAFGIVLLANASAIVPTAIAAIYVAGVTLDMIQASVAFVQHFGFMIHEMQT